MGAILMGLAAQAGLIYGLAERPRASLPPPPSPTVIHLAVDAVSAQRLRESPTLIDPTVFALPSHQGFSGRAWLRFTPPAYQLTDWSEPHRWLDLNAAPLGGTFARFVTTNESPPLRVADKAAPKLPLDELTAPRLLMPTNSSLRIEGDLAGRPLLAPLMPMAWPHAEILGPTEVQLLVNGGGFVVSTVLLAESGLRAADQHAIELARAAHFAPVTGFKRSAPPAHAATLLTRGRIVFFWHTLPAPGTNTAAITP